MNKQKQQEAYQSTKDLCIDAGELLECFQWEDFDLDSAKVPTVKILGHALRLCYINNLDVDAILKNFKKS